MPAGDAQRGGMASDLRCHRDQDIKPPRAFFAQFLMRAS